MSRREKERGSGKSYRETQNHKKGDATPQILGKKERGGPFLASTKYRVGKHGFEHGKDMHGVPEAHERWTGRKMTESKGEKKNEQWDFWVISRTGRHIRKKSTSNSRLPKKVQEPKKERTQKQISPISEREQAERSLGISFRLQVDQRGALSSSLG